MLGTLVAICVCLIHPHTTLLPLFSYSVMCFFPADELNQSKVAGRWLLNVLSSFDPGGDAALPSIAWKPTAAAFRLIIKL